MCPLIISVIHRRCQRAVILQALVHLSAQFFPVFGPVLDAVNPFVQVSLHGLRDFADLIPVQVKTLSRS